MPLKSESSLLFDRLLSHVTSLQNARVMPFLFSFLSNRESGVADIGD